MSTEESYSQKSFYQLLIAAIYMFIALDIYLHCFSPLYEQSSNVAQRLHDGLRKLPFLYNVYWSHLTTLGMIILVSLGTLSKKDTEFRWMAHVVIPGVIGSVLFAFSATCWRWFDGSALIAAYSISYLVGAVLLHLAFGNISKRIIGRKPKDIWNTEQESFEQNRSRVDSDYSYNLPMRFYFSRKWNTGWININPFRGMMVIGVPGSGKTESTIVPFINQMLGKGFSMLVYDFKYPDLSAITYQRFLELQHQGLLTKHKFCVLNLDQLEYSVRVNPIDAKYIETLADASETAEALLAALRKGDKSSSGSDQFFTQSAINFMSACIYFFAKYKDGKYSTLPHVLAFLTLPYDKIFTTLYTNTELVSLLSPFQSAYEKKAFDQLEGQIGTLKINISRIATKESFWVFSANDIDLKISDPHHPTVFCMGNTDKSQNINSAFYSCVLLRTLRLINTKGNNPCALVIDETPTIYLHRIENLLATARSNKVAVMLGLQELPQFNQQYGRETANVICSIMGSVLSGAVRNKETLDWLEKLCGRIKMKSQNISIDRNRTTISENERFDALVPAAKIASLNPGEMVGVVSPERPNTQAYTPNVFKCQITLPAMAVDGSRRLPPIPPVYDFGTPQQKNEFLQNFYKSIFDELLNDVIVETV